MITNQETLDIMYEEGRRQALDLQGRAPSMTGTEIIAEENKVPTFNATKDYSSWPIGAPVADEGQVWILIQPHNASHYTGRPSTLRALWGLAHTKDPHKAKSYVAPYGTSGLYMIDEVCTYNGYIWRNLWDNNEYPPETLNVENRWEKLRPCQSV